MASITIRDLDDSLKSRLRVQAAVHGRSMEDEARNILRLVLNQEPQGPKNLGTAINELFKPFGGFEMPEVLDQPLRELQASTDDSSLQEHPAGADADGPLPDLSASLMS